MIREDTAAGVRQLSWSSQWFEELKRLVPVMP